MIMASVCLASRFNTSNGNEAVSPFVTAQLEEDNVEALIQKIRAGSAQDRKFAFDALQELLETENDGFVDTLIEINTLSVLMNCLEDQEDPPSQVPPLQHEALLSKKQSQAVVNCGAVIPFIQLVDSTHMTIAEQAVICVGNIACEDAFTRKVLYENGGLHAVLRFLKRPSLEPAQLNSGVWAFSNMCRSRTLISLDILASCVDTIGTLLETEDPEILRSVCAATAYLTDGPSDRVQMFLSGGICKSILKLTHHGSTLVVFSALRAVSNFLSGSDAQIEELVAMDVVASLAHVMRRHKERRMVKETCMALSNITAGAQDDIALVVEENLVGDLIHIARHAPLDVRTEAVWALGNAIVGSGHVLIKEFSTPDCMKVLSAALTSKHPDLIKVALDAIRNLLWCGDFGEDPNFDLATWDSENDEDFWEHADWLSNAHGFYRLAKLRLHPDSEIAKSSLLLLEALVEDPCADYSDAESVTSSMGDGDESDYEDILTTMQSPTYR